MRDALAYFVVDGDECAIRSEGLLDSASDSLRVHEKRRDQIDRKIGERFVVRARDKENVPFEYRPRIQEPEARFVLEDTMGRSRRRRDLTEDAGHAFRLALPRPLSRAVALLGHRRTHPLDFAPNVRQL